MSFHRKSDLNDEPVELSPHELSTNSTCRVTSSFKFRAILLAIDWSRVSSTTSTTLSPIDLSTYECSPLDLDCYIQTKIKYKTDQGISEVTKRRGPVSLQPQIQNLVQGSKINLECLKVYTRIEDNDIEIVFKLEEDALVMICKETFEYRMKLKALPVFGVKEDTTLIYFGVKQYSETITKFFSAVLKRVPKNKLFEFDVRFESRFHRDLFLMKIVRTKNSSPKLITKRSMTFSNQPKPGSSTVAMQKDHQIPNPQPAASNIRLVIPQVAQLEGSQLTLKPSPSQSLCHSPNNFDPSPSTSEDRLCIRKPNSSFNPQEFKLEMENLLEEGGRGGKGCLNIFDESESVGADKQDALNLRESFLIFENQSRKEAQIKSSEVSFDVPSFKSLNDACGHINKLMLDIHLLKQQNLNLKQQIVKISHNQGTDFMQQKIQHLERENSRLVTDRAKVLEDLQTTEHRCRKEREEKRILKEILDQFSEQKARFEKIVGKDQTDSPFKPKQVTNEIKEIKEIKEMKEFREIKQTKGNLDLREVKLFTTTRVQKRSISPGLHMPRRGPKLSEGLHMSVQNLQGLSSMKPMFAALNPST